MRISLGKAQYLIQSHSIFFILQLSAVESRYVSRFRIDDHPERGNCSPQEVSWDVSQAKIYTSYCNITVTFKFASHHPAHGKVILPFQPLPITVKKASQLRGLTFGNGIDSELLQRGLPRRALSFLYGIGTERMINVLCTNSVRAFDTNAIFVDASNSADPYLIAKLSRTKKKNSSRVEKILDSIFIIRAFTCYQLYDIIAKQLPQLIRDSKANSVFVSGVDHLFNEQDNSKEEIERLQTLMSFELCSIANDKKTEVEFVVASAKDWSKQFVSRSKVAIKFSEKTALLMKSDEMQFAEVLL
jgi:hypothetical protein